MKNALILETTLDVYYNILEMLWKFYAYKVSFSKLS